VVTVATDAAQEDSFADLTIGNSNTDDFALKDVQIFDARPSRVTCRWTPR